MPTQGPSGKPNSRRYSDAERAQAVRLVRQLRAELGTDHGTVKRVAEQLGYGVESVRAWVRQADIDDGVKPGTTTEDAETIKALEQEVKELRRANAILRSASAFFAAELDRPSK
jgi:transposase